MAFVHVWGNGTVRYDQHDILVNGHIFFHTYGNIPQLYYTSVDTIAKAQMHLIVGI